MNGNNSESKKPKVTAIVPVLNESKNLPFFLPKLLKYVDDIIIVDGHSTDDTVKKAQTIVPKARILFQEGQGKGDALREGFKHVTGDYIVMIDADCSHIPSEIPRFIDALKNGYDVVKGSRLIKNGGSDDLTTFRLFGNILFVTLTNLLHRTSFTDLCYGFKAFKRGTLKYFTIEAEDFDIETEMAIRMHRAGLRITEVPSYEKKRKHGKTNLSAIEHGIKILRTIFREFLLKYNIIPTERRN
ncbi:MAG: glycosyltransferase family 2 protein [Candidatus Hodarchaeales archaeon]|jgi:glycosyltransferase involved in cell wall biosynthesis